MHQHCWGGTTVNTNATSHSLLHCILKKVVKCILNCLNWLLTTKHNKNQAERLCVPGSEGWCTALRGSRSHRRRRCQISWWQCSRTARTGLGLPPNIHCNQTPSPGRCLQRSRGDQCAHFLWTRVIRTDVESFEAELAKSLQTTMK